MTNDLDGLVAELRANLQDLHKKREELARLIGDLDRDIAAVVRTREIVGRPRGSDVTDAELERLEGHYQPTVMDAVREIVQSFRDATFTIREVRSAIEDHFPTFQMTENSLSVALRRLRESGAIEVREQGSGRRPSVYRRLAELSENHAYENGTAR